MTPPRETGGWPAGSLSSTHVVMGTVLGFALSAELPATAWALCPNCLGQARALTPTMKLLGAFLLVPFVVFLVVLRVIRRANRF